MHRPNLFSPSLCPPFWPALLVLAVILLIPLTLPRTAAAASLDATFDPMVQPVHALMPTTVPIGTIIAWPVSTSPAEAEKWLDCDGRSVTAADYPDLVAVLTGSATAQSTTLPDLRGLFLRGRGSRTHLQYNGHIIGLTSTVHQSGALGRVQGDATREIYGTLPVGEQMPGAGWFNQYLTGVFSWSMPSDSAGLGASDRNNVHTYFSAARVVPTANEIRPVNMAVRYLIRAL